MIPSVRISTGIEEPKAATTTRPNIFEGIEISASRKRLSAISKTPPEGGTPRRPSSRPEPTEIIVATNAIPTV